MSTAAPAFTISNGSRGGTTGGDPAEPGVEPAAPPVAGAPPLVSVWPAPLPAEALTPSPPVSEALPAVFAPACPSPRPAAAGVPSAEGPAPPAQPAPSMQTKARNDRKPRLKRERVLSSTVIWTPVSRGTIASLQDGLFLAARSCAAAARKFEGCSPPAPRGHALRRRPRNQSARCATRMAHI